MYKQNIGRMIIFRKEEKDWKSLLREDAKILLSEIFEQTKKHRGAYSYAKDVKHAQLWCAIVELKRELRELNERIKKLEETLGPILSVSDEEKRKTIEKLIEEFVPSKEKKEKEKIVESLMKL